MSLQINTREDEVPPASSTSLERSRKRSRLGHEDFIDRDDDDDDYGSSINPLFLVSGPRGGVINALSADAELKALADFVDDGVYHVLKEAWEEVSVPADMYWRCPEHLYRGDPASALLRRYTATAAAAASTKSLPPRIPHPRQLISSFYPVRVEALAARGYQPHRGLVPVALDRKGGKGSKVFNVLARWDAETNSTFVEESGDLEQGSLLHTFPLPAPPLRTSAIARFIDTIPRPTDRNLYVLVDEACPVDPYFDVDFAYNAVVDHYQKLAPFQPASGTNGATTLGIEAVEKALLTILSTLRREVETEWNTQVQECLVLTSSVQLGHLFTSTTTAASSSPALEEIKLSFHVHFRLSNRAAMESVKELHAFMTALRIKLQRIQMDSASDDSAEAREDAMRATLLLECVDFGVCTRWRAFRFPYNVKAPDSHSSNSSTTAAKPLAEGAGDELLAAQLGQLGISLPDIEVGSAAPAVMQSVLYAADTETQEKQRYLVQKLIVYFRYLLPLLPGVTRFATAALKAFLSSLVPKEVGAALVVKNGRAPPSAKDVISAWVMEMACIIRDASELTASTTPQLKENTTVVGKGGGEVEETATKFKLLQYRRNATDASSAAIAQTTSNPFDMPMPPMPRSVRVRVDDKEVKKLLAEVFWCIAPEYQQASSQSAGTSLETQYAPSAAITPERISAQYEESIRAYYVFQKQSKFCMRLQRTHRATYVQLYLTFGSIKIRCYSNDCCDRCCVVPWEAPENPKSVPQHHEGYPKFDRLREIHRALFPPLPAGELVRRYGTAVLHHQLQ